MPEHGLALSDQATDYFKWVNFDNHPTPFLNLQNVPGESGNPPIWDSVPFDVRGKPDISIQLGAFGGPGTSEVILRVYIYVSLDGQHWNLVPQSMMAIDPTGADITADINSQTFISLFLRTNFIRLHAWLPGGTVPFPDFTMLASIVAGEA